MQVLQTLTSHRIENLCITTVGILYMQIPKLGIDLEQQGFELYRSIKLHQLKKNSCTSGPVQFKLCCSRVNCISLSANLGLASLQCPLSVCMTVFFINL